VKSVFERKEQMGKGGRTRGVGGFTLGGERSRKQKKPLDTLKKREELNRASQIGGDISKERGIREMQWTSKCSVLELGRANLKRMAEIMGVPR